jgi:cytochrome c
MKMSRIAAWCVILSAPLFAQLTTPPGCSALNASDFKATELFDKTGEDAPIHNDKISEPVQMDIQPIYTGDSVSSVQIYFVERLGGVKMFDGKTVTTLATLPTWAKKKSGENDNGLMGIALHPDFANNHWLYVWYTPPVPDTSYNRIMRLSRFTVLSNNTLDTGRIILTVFGSKTDQYHCGGPMTFDAYGDLWVTVGNNSRDANPNGGQVSNDSSASAEWGSSNTHSLRGGVLRIHPDSSEKGYSIPAGNFGEYWSKQFESQGRLALAKEYKDSSKVSPEVYIKGTRSNYSIAVHPTKRWLAWGEVNFNSQDDEFNIVTHPAFTGFPYFHANNKTVPGSPTSKSISAPINNSPLNSGVDTLPPATPATLWWSNTLTTTTLPTNVAIGGPIYVYDRNLKIKTKFPPHMNNSWLLFSELASTMYMTFLDSTNATLKGIPTRLDNGLIPITLRNPLQAKYGPDGSLYILNYSGRYTTINPGIARIDYKGTCQLASVPISENLKSRSLQITFTTHSLKVQEPGTHTFTLYDISGNLLIEKTGIVGAEYTFDALRTPFHLQAGIHLVRVKTEQGIYSRSVSFL